MRKHGLELRDVGAYATSRLTETAKGERGQMVVGAGQGGAVCGVARQAQELTLLHARKMSASLPNRCCQSATFFPTHQQSVCGAGLHLRGASRGHINLEPLRGLPLVLKSPSGGSQQAHPCCRDLDQLIPDHIPTIQRLHSIRHTALPTVCCQPLLLQLCKPYELKGW